ncbi:hypothetical protein [Dyella sp. A6]|uniref:hypothetical protein n=1 Tax=Dyella aluminiiresistens TaxID=3069105 RepID=UPI002E78913A|nr:hypothetical protein [Dyella sp. A6]
MKRLAMLPLVAAAGLLAPSARAGTYCWVDHAIPQANSVKLEFAVQPRYVGITHRDGSHTRFYAETSKPMTVNLHIGEAMEVSQGLHSDCQIKATRVDGRLRIVFTLGVGMPGLPPTKSIEVLEAGADGRFHRVAVEGVK